MMDYQQQLAAMAAAPNPNVICKKQGMSYLEAYYVRLLANRIFGPTSVHITSLEHSLNQSTDSGRVEVEYTCTTTIKVLFANGDHRVLMGTGGGRGYGPEAHQQAKMEAESHSYKRCMSNLGPAFGLTLYDGTNPLHNNGECCWKGFQEDRRSQPPIAGPPPSPDPAPAHRVDTPKPEPAAETTTPKTEPIPEPTNNKWTEAQRKGFCASLNRLGFKYEDFKQFAIHGLDAESPSTWDENDRGRAIKDLSPGGSLRQRVKSYVAAQQEEEDMNSREPVKTRGKNPVPPFQDDDIPF